MIQLNLLPDVKKDYLKSQRMKRNIITISILTSIVAGVLVALLALYVHGAQRIARNQLQSDIDKNSKEVESLTDINKVLTVQGALAALPGLHDKKNINSRLFEYLKVVVPNEVSLSKLELTHKGNTLKLTGRSSDYKSLNVFVDTLKSAQLTYGPDENRTSLTPFKNVTISNATKSPDPQKPGIEFLVTLEFNPVIFNTKTQNPKMSVPNTTTGQGFVKSNELFSGSKDETSGGTQ